MLLQHYPKVEVSCRHFGMNNIFVDLKEMSVTNYETGTLGLAAFRHVPSCKQCFHPQLRPTVYLSMTLITEEANGGNSSHQGLCIYYG